MGQVHLANLLWGYGALGTGGRVAQGNTSSVDEERVWAGARGTGEVTEAPVSLF